MDEPELGLVISSCMMVIQSVASEFENERLREEEVDTIMLNRSRRDKNAQSSVDNCVNSVALHQSRMLLSLVHWDDDERWWVKSRLMSWFQEFLMREYDNKRWIQLFRMTKETVMGIVRKVEPLIGKRDTRYRGCVPTETRVCCVLYKLAQGANILTCSEMFAIGRSTVYTVLREVVGAINIVFKDLVSWPSEEEVQEIVNDFKAYCSMPSIHGVIDVTHIAIAKPAMHPEDYYYHKSGAYSIVMQAVVDKDMRFRDVYIGLPGSVNDSRTLRKSGLYRRVVNESLLSAARPHTGNIPPCLLGDKGYPLLPWLLTPFKDDGEERTVNELLYNRRHRRGRTIVEHAFGNLKQLFRELLNKTDLAVEFVPDLVFTCVILHNMILWESDVDIDYLWQVLEEERREDENDPNFRRNQMEDDRPDRAAMDDVAGRQARTNVVAYLGNQPIRE